MKKILSLIALMFVSAIAPNVVAADSATNNPDMAYSIKANTPNNQVDKKLTYFNLQLKPGEQEDISLHLKNTSSETSTFNVKAIHASTNKNGVIDYSNSKVKDDKSFKYKWNKIITPSKQTVTLKGNQETDVKFHITMPKKEYRGIILGGFHIQKKVPENRQSEKGVTIRNRFAYIVGLSLQNEPAIAVPELRLHKIKPALDNSYTAITANLQNPSKTIIHKFDVTVNIYKRGSNKVLYAQVHKNMAMAPNSNFDFPISLNNDPIKPGKYTANVHATSEKTKYVWNLSRNFEIKDKDAKDLNDKAVVLNKDWTWLIILAIVVALILIGIIIWLIMALRRHNKFNDVKKKRLSRINRTK